MLIIPSKETRNQKLVDDFRRHIMKDPLIHGFPEVSGRVMNLPVCPNCERPTLRDTRSYDPVQSGYATCPVCGWHGKGAHSIKYHIENYVVGSGNPAPLEEE